MLKNGIKLENLQKFWGGGKKNAWIVALFCHRAPKTTVYKQNFCKFLIFINFKLNSSNFLPKGAGFWGEKKKFAILHQNAQNLMYKNAIKSQNLQKFRGGLKKMLEF